MIPHDPNTKLTAAEKLVNERNIIMFRNVFTGKEGELVWAFLHRELGTFGSEPQMTPDEVVLRSFGMKMLEWAGINYEVNLVEVLEKLMQVRPSYETHKLLDTKGDKT